MADEPENAAPPTPPEPATPGSSTPVAAAAPPAGPSPPPSGDARTGEPRDQRRRRDRDRGPRPQQQQAQGQGQRGPGAPREGQRGAGGPRHEGRPERREPRPGSGPRQPWAHQEFLARAVRSGLDKEFMDRGVEFSRAVLAGAQVTQLRAIAGEVARQEILGLDVERLRLLKPRLSFIAMRSGRTEMREARVVLERGLDAVCEEGVADDDRKRRFERLRDGLEALLIYGRVFERKLGERG